MAPILFRLSVATLSAVAGGLVTSVLGRRTSRGMLPLIFIALGTLLAVTLFDVLPEAKESLSWPVFLVTAASGYFVFWLISRYLYSICPACAFNTTMKDAQHCAPGADDSTIARAKAVAGLLTVALAIHCTVDGLAVVVGDDLARGFDPAMLAAITIHKFPEGMALALFLISAGRRPATAFLWTALVESATVIGGLVGAHLLTPQSIVPVSLVFAHIGGGFVYLVAATLSGIATTGAGNRRPVLIGGGVAFTITSVLLLSLHA